MSKQEIKQIVLDTIQASPYVSHIKRVALFGSYLSGKQKDDSDVDLLIEFSQPLGLFKFIEIQEYLKDKIKKDIDLVTPNALSKYFRDDILKQAENIYER